MEYLQFFGGLLLLLAGGNYLVKSSVSVARHFQISTLVVGVVIVSLGTSAPELVVSIGGVLKDIPEFSIGTVIGSNISNIGLVLGLTAFVFPILINKNSIRIDWPIMMLASVLFLFFISNGVLGMWEGICFVTLLILYIVFLLRKSKRENIRSEKKIIIPEYSLTISAILILFSSLSLVFGADQLVKGGSTIAENIGVSKRVISLTFIALGTSLPELVTSLIAAFKKETDISVGNIIGSNIFNIFGILGVTAIIKPISIAKEIASYDIWWMLGISVLLFAFIIPVKKARLNKTKGICLALVYFIYIFLVFYK
ncbi:calcium/sodium antiporter [Bacteroidota bacterium]